MVLAEAAKESREAASNFDLLFGNDFEVKDV
jgi:hypothetical protein